MLKRRPRGILLVKDSLAASPPGYGARSDLSSHVVYGTPISVGLCPAVTIQMPVKSKPA